MRNVFGTAVKVVWVNETVTAAESRRDMCARELFEAQVKRTPGAVAVIFQSEQLTYAQLNARANQLADRLVSLGVGPDSLVGICVERTPEMVVGLLAILKAGGAYLPLDPQFPSERLAFMLKDANVAVLLTQKDLVDKLRAGLKVSPSQLFEHQTIAELSNVH